MGDHVYEEDDNPVNADVATPVNTGVPTQIAHPAKATWRTVFAVLVAVLSGVIVLGPEIIQAILVEDTLPENFRLALTAVSTVIVAIAGIITRIMAIPGVNELLKKIGLGTGVESE